ncbi:MAG: hypothetical protein EXR68_05155 [Dehalococcoidia bacterium]|nr:hypothetical protein [Dehalococcoidia bacterium]
MTCVLVALVGIAGVVSHVVSNYETTPLDTLYSLKWGSMSLAGWWCTAASGGVGPAPPLAPAALVIDALCIALATWRHPVSRLS